MKDFDKKLTDILLQLSIDTVDVPRHEQLIGYPVDVAKKAIYELLNNLKEEQQNVRG